MKHAVIVQKDDSLICYNERQIHLWSILDGRKIFDVDFQQET
jgi:hypothetical protein